MIEEYTELINSIVTNADTAPIKAQELIEKLKTDLTTLDSLKSDNEALNSKVKTLQETNIKLYMSQGDKSIEDNETKEKTEEEVETEEVEAFFNELNGGKEE